MLTNIPGSSWAPFHAQWAHARLFSAHKTVLCSVNKEYVCSIVFLIRRAHDQVTGTYEAKLYGPELGGINVAVSRVPDLVLAIPNMPGTLRSRCHDLPQELTDAIVDHLHDDRPSLQACALVCSAWLDPSRYHLFRSLTVSQYGLLKSTVDFLISCPDVAWYVERFIVLGEEITNLSLKWDHFSLLLSRLPRLRVLHLTQFVLGVNRTGLKDGGTAPLLPLLKYPHAGPVEEIHIDTSNLVTYDFAILLHFLALFSSIRRLSLTVGRIRLLHEDGIPGLGTRAPAHIALRELRTSDIPLPVVAKLVTETRTAETLRVLWFNDVLVWWTDEDVELLGRIFAALGRHGSLRKLIFGPIPILVPPPYGYPPLHMLDAAPGACASSKLECSGPADLVFLFRPSSAQSPIRRGTASTSDIWTVSLSSPFAPTSSFPSTLRSSRTSREVSVASVSLLRGSSRARMAVSGLRSTLPSRCHVSRTSRSSSTCRRAATTLSRRNRRWSPAPKRRSRRHSRACGSREGWWLRWEGHGGLGGVSSFVRTIRVATQT